IGIEKLRSRIVRGVARVEPDDINSSVGRDRKCAEPVPFRVLYRIFIDPSRRGEGLASVSAAHKHYVAAGAETGGLNAGEHVTVVVCNGARTIRREENLTH